MAPAPPLRGDLGAAQWRVAVCLLVGACGGLWLHLCRCSQSDSPVSREKEKAKMAKTRAAEAAAKRSGREAGRTSRMAFIDDEARAD